MWPLICHEISEGCSVHFEAFVLLAFTGRNITLLDLYAQIHMWKVTLQSNCARIDILNIGKPEINWLHTHAGGAYLGTSVSHKLQKL